MWEERNNFIAVMNYSIKSKKKRLQNILNKIGWSLQSLTRNTEEGDDAEVTVKEQSSNGDESLCNNLTHVTAGTTTLEKSTSQLHTEGCPFPINGIHPWMLKYKVETLCLGIPTESEKEYNELLASLSFQPKVKKEKLSSTQLLASLLENERNAKRRRISYRNKVHTKNKSKTEILREVIHEQMEVLRGEQDSNESTNGVDKEKTDEDNEMLEVNVSGGNPHLAWQTVGSVVEEQQRVKEKYSDNHTNSSHKRRSSTDRPKKHSDRYRSRSPARRERSPKRNKSRDSHRRRRSSSREHHSKKKKHSSKRHLKHRRSSS